ncbi:5'-deoxynucleotidase [Citrus sinensis]|uniref:5'-deoxynucleotidase n=1 Tax=Citrus sinensis TaxID=2711 RepID=A0ACB8LF55_CITSI|nr:5'-deoxynucleotidase [Citrus sinensis]
MAVNSSTHRALPLNRPVQLRFRLSPAFFYYRTSSRPLFSSDAPNLRLVSVRAHKAGSDGFSNKKSVNLTDSEAPIGSSRSSTSSAIDFLTLCHSLKTTKRKGWINHGIKGPESIADHMYRMALMALIAGDIPGVDRERCIKIAIVHDIAEAWDFEENGWIGCEEYGNAIEVFLGNAYVSLGIYRILEAAIVGDITPSDGVPKEVKSRMEQEALNEMCKVLGGGMRAEEIQELWAEYENNASIEANLVKDFDKVEMILQALEYEMGKLLDEFSAYMFCFCGFFVVFLICYYNVMTEHGKVLDEFFLSTADRNRKALGSRDQFKKKLKVGEQTQLISWSGHGSLPSEAKPNFFEWSTTDFLSRSNPKGASIGDYWIRKAVKIWKFNIAASISC